MNKWKFIIIEVQLIALFVLIIWKFNSIDYKVSNTNKFVHNALIDKQTEEILQIDNDEIIIGYASAPVTMIYYTRFDCSACKDFYNETFEHLKQNYIKKGLLKMAIRPLLNSENDKTLYAVKGFLFAFRNNFLESYMNLMNDNFPDTDSKFIRELIFEIRGDTAEITSFFNDKIITSQFLSTTKKAHDALIKGTPVIFINQHKIRGNIKYKKLESAINDELDQVMCL